MNLLSKLAVVLVIAQTITTSCKTKKQMGEGMQNSERCWWKEAVVYQIYPRSFKDSDGDGVGDLKGITEKLDYIQNLGVDVVWLNPIFSSPNDDNGYDISDYRGIMKEFGTMEDFEELLDGMHKRGIKLILDLVVTHSSDEHQWFKESRSSRDNPYRNYYHWWPAEKGKPAHRWSFFDVNGDAWKYDQQTNAYYLHYFSEKQPDLNWENPQVRDEIYRMMRFWFDKGVDGFRMDVIPFISKDTTFPHLPAHYHGDFGRYYAEGPNLHKYLREMNQEVLSKYNVLSVAEGIGVTPETALNFVSPARKELNMLYHFDAVGLGLLPGEFKAPHPDGYCLLDFKNIFSRWDSVFEHDGWGTIYLGNHDNPRMLTRWGDDSPEFREVSSKMLTTFLLTMRATPFYYFGDELGMSNIKFDNIEDYQDIESKNMYLQIKMKGGDLNRFLENQKMTARENGRTPFHWDSSENGGFTTGTPWLKIHPDHKTVNASTQQKDENSILNYFKKLIQLRKKELTLVYGKYSLVDYENPNVYSYTRTLNGKTILVSLNFKPFSASVNFNGINLQQAKLLLGNYTEPVSQASTLRPYEAVVFELN